MVTRPRIISDPVELRSAESVANGDVPLILRVVTLSSLIVHDQSSVPTTAESFHTNVSPVIVCFIVIVIPSTDASRDISRSFRSWNSTYDEIFPASIPLASTDASSVYLVSFLAKLSTRAD